ncbi:MAG: GTPase Era [Clostridia bacterium]|jgi:GTP-binding protein Era|nr:GTPase Era [Oscillospiraceae bacterium]MBQ2773788.1 GTPase Era [Clostridia bacterium]MBQ3057135.1 GTPase Era [Clostridia bacterium]
MKKSGYIAIVGRPNVGKSTLLNALLGEKIAIVSNKPQTTRNRILGILTRGEAQFVFIDTPGIHKPQNSLGDFMVETANASMKEADAVVLMVDAGREITAVEENVIRYLKQSGIPAVLALNKTDLYTAVEIAESIKRYAAAHDFAAVVPLCAKNGKQVFDVLDECEKLLAESEWFFPDDMITDQPERQIAAEIIREKLLRTLNKEVPHGVAVVIEEFKDEGNLVRIRAEIFCEKASHKGIIVGKNGAELKMVGTYARQDLEKLFGTKVYLNLWVKVKENWRDSRVAVGNFGYREEK